MDLSQNIFTDEGTIHQFILEGFIISAFLGSGQSNRLFVILAIGLIGLICLGLFALAGFFFFNQSGRDQAQALTTALPPSPFPATFTPTATASPTPTETPLPTPTSTSVISLDGGEGEVGEQPALDTPTSDPNATPTNTQVLQTATLTVTPEPTAAPTLPPEVIPDSGAVLPVNNDDFLMWIGGGLLFVVVIYGLLSRFKLFSQSSGK